MPARYLLYTNPGFMKITRKTAVILILILFFVIIGISRIIRHNSKSPILEQLELDAENLFQKYLEDDTSYIRKQVMQMNREKNKIKFIKKIISSTNDRQRIGPVKKFNATLNTNLSKAWQNYKNISGLKLNTVLVIQVHGNSEYVKVFLESISRVSGIDESLLIFVHDYYDSKVYKILNNFHFARVMQLFYPYSVQLHPFRFPGEDLKFCPKLYECIKSNERDPLKSQSKLFWWWIINQVFDHVGVLKGYDGYVYFLEIEQFLAPDFIYIAKQLEEKQPRYCPDCSILSLAARPPRPELYRPENTSVIVSVWGWSKTKYISSGFGLNRTTWEEIKLLKEEFCYFNDNTWENSLKHLASHSRHKQFFMLSVEGPRIFPTNDLNKINNNGTSCLIYLTYQQIVKFIQTTSRGMFPFRWNLEFDSMDGLNNTDVVEPSDGLWEDARDRELCIFIASNGRRLYY